MVLSYSDLARPLWKKVFGYYDISRSSETTVLIDKALYSLFVVRSITKSDMWYVCVSLYVYLNILFILVCFMVLHAVIKAPSNSDTIFFFFCCQQKFLQIECNCPTLDDRGIWIELCLPTIGPVGGSRDTARTIWLKLLNMHEDFAFIPSVFLDVWCSRLSPCPAASHRPLFLIFVSRARVQQTSLVET